MHINADTETANGALSFMGALHRKYHGCCIGVHAVKVEESRSKDRMRESDFRVAERNAGHLSNDDDHAVQATKGWSCTATTR